jgi:DnaJ domain
MRPALKLAFDLFDFPSQARFALKAPLPTDLILLLRIAAGDDEALREAVRISGRPPRVVRDAAGFYIEQALLFPEADSYRVLGASPTAANSELRRNMALLLRWLHPDIDQQGERSVFTARVTKAWSDVKTPERRSAYDQQLLKMQADARFREKRRSRRSKGQSLREASRGATRQACYHFKEEAGLLRRLLFTIFGRATF